MHQKSCMCPNCRCPVSPHLRHRGTAQSCAPRRGWNSGARPRGAIAPPRSRRVPRARPGVPARSRCQSGHAIAGMDRGWTRRRLLPCPPAGPGASRASPLLLLLLVPAPRVPTAAPRRQLGDWECLRLAPPAATPIVGRCQTGVVGAFHACHGPTASLGCSRRGEGPAGFGAQGLGLPWHLPTGSALYPTIGSATVTPTPPGAWGTKVCPVPPSLEAAPTPGDHSRLGKPSFYASRPRVLG